MSTVTMTEQVITNLREGNVDPNDFFRYTGPVLDMHNYFDHPVENFGKVGSWEFNNSRDISPKDIEFVKQLIFSPYDEIYQLQFDDNADIPWVICAKVSQYYIHFEASYTYTGFECGGGSFSYSTEWPTLWNRYMTRDARIDLLLTSDDYNAFVGPEKVPYPRNLRQMIKGDLDEWGSIKDD